MNTFNDVLLKALRKAKQTNLSEFDTVGLVSDYMDIAGIPIPGAPPETYTQYQVPVKPLINNVPSETQAVFGNIAISNNVPEGTMVVANGNSPIILKNLSIQSPIDMQVKTVDELYAEIQCLAPNEVEVEIPQSKQPLVFAVEVSKLTVDPNPDFKPYVRIKFVDPNDRGTSFNTVIYYPEDVINVEKDIADFKEAMLKIHNVRVNGIATSFQKITAPPSVFDNNNSMNLGHIVVDGRR